MIFVFISFLLISVFHSKDLYIRPFSGDFPCSVSGGSIPCDGTYTNPYDSLIFAFVYGVSINIPGDPLNFYLQSSGPIVLNSSESDSSTISPFENFEGKFLMKKFQKKKMNINRDN